MVRLRITSCTRFPIRFYDDGTVKKSIGSMVYASRTTSRKSEIFFIILRVLKEINFD